MNFLAQLLAVIAVEILKALLARRDLMEKGQAAEFEAALKHANAALAWKATSAASPDHGATVGVRPDAPPITIPGYNPPAPEPPAGDSMQRPEPNDMRGTP